MVHVEPLRPGDRAALSDLRRMAFGDIERHDPDSPMIADDRISCVYEGDRLVATALAREFAQWFGGRAVPCGGLSGVMVATDRRDSGLARSAVTHALHQMAERGEVISSLYPTTTSLYRSVGYEVGGSYRIQRIPIEDLPATDGSLTWEPSTWLATDVRAVENRAGIDHDGWIVRTEIDYQWADYRRRKGAVSTDVYVGRRDGKAVAVVATEYGPSEEAIFTLSTPTAVGVDHDAHREALAFLGRHGTSANQADVKLPDHLLHVLLAHPQRASPVREMPWMSRIVTLAGALEARGWNPAVSVTLDLEVTDPVVTANDGRWRVEIDDGSAAVKPGGNGSIRGDIGAIASWYTGHTPPAALARRGRIAAENDLDLARMTAVVSGGEAPTLNEHF